MRSKSNTGFRLVSKIVTLNSLEPRIRVVQQCAAISATAAMLREQPAALMSWSRSCCWPTWTQQMAYKYGSWNLNKNAYIAVVQLLRSKRTDLAKRSMLKKTYSPLSKFNASAAIIISRTVSGEAQRTTTKHRQEHRPQQSLWKAETAMGMGFAIPMVIPWEWNKTPVWEW